VKAGQRSLRLIACVLNQQPRPERDEIGRFKFVQRRFPRIAAHDRGATLVDAEGRRRHGIAPVAAFMFANLKPPLNGLLDCRDIGAARPGGGTRFGVFAKCPRLLERCERRVSIARLYRLGGVSNLVSGSFIADSFPYI
jgi:hypothetical protein